MLSTPLCFKNVRNLLVENNILSQNKKKRSFRSQHNECTLLLSVHYWVPQQIRTLSDFEENMNSPDFVEQSWQPTRPHTAELSGLWWIPIPTGPASQWSGREKLWKRCWWRWTWSRPLESWSWFGLIDITKTQIQIQIQVHTNTSWIFEIWSR